MGSIPTSSTGSATASPWPAPRTTGATLTHVYEHTDRLADETLQAYYQPFVASHVAGRNLERLITSIDARHTVEIEGLLKELHVPTLILWGTGDNIFPLRWAYWLKATIPGAREIIELPGAKLWSPEEYPEFVSEKLRAHWTRGNVGRRYRTDIFGQCRA